MNKLVIALTIGITSTSVFAADDYQSLQIQSGNPPPMSGQSQQNQNYSQPNQNYSQQNPYSIAAGYAGSKIGSDEFGGDEQFTGFFINGSYHSGQASTWLEYANQEAEGLNFNEVSTGIQYKLAENNGVYAAIGAGVGFAWLRESDDDVSVDLNYITIPINLELGAKVTPIVSGFLNLGYKWFINQTSQACVGNTCGTGSDPSLNVDGVTYKAGLRFSF